MAMYDPPHPGEIVREENLVKLGLSVTRAAVALGVSRQALNNVVNEKSAISPEMAFRLEKVFGSSAEMWLKLQAMYDLAALRRHTDDILVRPITVAR